jgi:tetratricopeptide (TPR) repeat protein
MTRKILLLLPLLLLACGSTPPLRQPQAIEQTLSADNDARRALRNGDLLNALHDFEKVLELQQSLDDTAGAAETMINLATVFHRMSADEAALSWLDKILLEKERIYPPESILTASFRKAVILTNLARISEAETALKSAETLCEQKCALSYGIEVLHARLLLLKGDADGALAIAQVLGGKDVGGKEEQANALRVAAMAEEKLARSSSALQHYQAALQIDKSLGLSRRIGEDLNGLARVSKQLGQDQDAAEYLRRANLVDKAYRQSISAR